MIPSGVNGCWFTCPCGEDMEQINCYSFIGIGQAMEACYLMTATPVKTWVHFARWSRERLGSMVGGDNTFRFDESGEVVKELLPLFDELVAAHAANGEIILTQNQIARYNALFFRFDNAAQIEFSRAPIFYVTPKGIYDTRRLITNADAAFEGFADRLPAEALADAKEAGRCFAFSLYTAAGFHIARATEAVIKQYMAVYDCSPRKKSQRNWGAYTEALTKKAANSIIIHHIDQLRELHRNPITHPEVTLTLAQANALHAMCLSVIQAMVGDMETKKKHPVAAIVALLPPEPDPAEEDEEEIDGISR